MLTVSRTLVFACLIIPGMCGRGGGYHHGGHTATAAPSQETRLSDGAIAGIVLGVLALLGLGVGGVSLYCKCKATKSSKIQDNAVNVKGNNNNQTYHNNAIVNNNYGGTPPPPYTPKLPL